SVSVSCIEVQSNEVWNPAENQRRYSDFEFSEKRCLPVPPSHHGTTQETDRFAISRSPNLNPTPIRPQLAPASIPFAPKRAPLRPEPQVSLIESRDSFPRQALVPAEFDCPSQGP